MQHVSGAARFVTDAELSIARAPVEPSLQLREIICQPIEPGRRLGASGEHRDGDRLLVHIHSEIDH
ncbi:MAG: hypothetical protein M3Z30_04800 [Gemmatimonadota bacterium]|nr:hypothetical protein [Gemmatimonadota bacterium]